MKTRSFNGNLITEYRDNNKITQSKFAKILNDKLEEMNKCGNYTNKAISSWENEGRQPRDLIVVKVLSQILGVSIDELCLNDVNRTSEKIANNTKESSCLVTDEESQVDNLEIGDRNLSFEIAQFFAGETISTNALNNAKRLQYGDILEIVKEFWIFQPIAVENDDSDYARPMVYYYGDDQPYLLSKGSKKINKYEFEQSVCEYALNNLNMFRDPYDLSTYVYDRFSTYSATEIFDVFFSDDLHALYKDVTDVNKISSSVEAVGCYYTDKGMLVRARASLKCPVEAILFLAEDYGFISDHKELTEFNKTKFEDLFE